MFVFDDWEEEGWIGNPTVPSGRDVWFQTSTKDFVLRTAEVDGKYIVNVLPPRASLRVEGVDLATEGDRNWMTWLDGKPLDGPS